MNSYNGFLTLVILLSCVYASYTDVRFKQIPNFLTFGLLAFGVFNHAWYYWVGEVPLGQVLGILLGGGFISFVLYIGGVWSPGDAKLYWGLCAVLPPNLLADVGGAKADVTPVMVGVNIFALYFTFALPYLLLKTTKSQKVQALVQTFHPRTLAGTIPQMLFTLPVFFGLSWTVNYLMNRLWFGSTVITRLLIVIVLFSNLNRFVSKHRLRTPLTYTFIVLGLLAILLVPGISTRFLVTLTGFLVVYILFRPLMLSLGHAALTRTVSISQLEPGMIPAEKILYTQMEGVRALSKIPAYFASPLGGEVIVDVDPLGLTPTKIEELKQMAEAGRLEGCENQIAVQRPLSFAPIIAGGVLLTLIYKGPFYMVLIGLLRSIS